MQKRVCWFKYETCKICLTLLSGNPKNAQNKSLFQLYIDANSIDNNKVDTGGKTESNEFTTKELYLVQEIAGTKDVFRMIVNSICPAIYGHEIVKGIQTSMRFLFCFNFLFCSWAYPGPFWGNPEVQRREE